MQIWSTLAMAAESERSRNIGDHRAFGSSKKEGNQKPVEGTLGVSLLVAGLPFVTDSLPVA
jgi:hypothetical protein